MKRCTANKVLHLIFVSCYTPIIFALGCGFWGRELYIPIRVFPLLVGSRLDIRQVTKRLPCARVRGNPTGLLIFCLSFPEPQLVTPSTSAPNVPPASDQRQCITRHVQTQLHSNNTVCAERGFRPGGKRRDFQVLSVRVTPARQLSYTLGNCSVTRKFVKNVQIVSSY